MESVLLEIKRGLRSTPFRENTYGYASSALSLALGNGHDFQLSG